MKHAVVVDDVEEGRYLLRAILQGSGYRVTMAGNGQAALEAARKDPPDVIVSDVLMPKMDGFALCRAWMLDATLKDIPFLFYSATYTHPEDVTLALDMGAMRYLIKPLEPDVLLGEITQAMQECKTRQSPSKSKFAMDTPAFEVLHDAVLARKLEDKITQLETTKNRLQATLDAIPDLLFEVDLDGRYMAVHAPRSELLVASKSDLLGKTVNEVMEPEGAAAVIAALAEANETGWSHGRQIELLLPQGPRWFELSVAKQVRADRAAPHFVVISRDITERKYAEEKVQALAFYDSLTGVANRRLLMDRMQQAVAASVRHRRSGALLFVDLDHFKDVNDVCGHAEGDRVLQEVAKRLASCVRSGDTIARLGGDEFVVLLEDLSENAMEAGTQARLVGEKILSLLGQPYVLSDGPRHGSASVGVTLFGLDAEMSRDGPLTRADLAMYQAKAVGGNTLRFFDPQMQVVVAARAALEADLCQALDEQSFVLYYQTQVCGQRICGVEALVRWSHPTRGMVSPLEFIGMAEETGLILPLGAWVLETACLQLVSWAHREDTAHLTIAVNVSAREMRQDDFVEQVTSALARTGANPHQLKLELTESLLVSNVEDTIVKMTALRGLGVRFSLDDFGTGFSSLSYLKRLPLDQLKIDQSFVRDILEDVNDAAIAKMVIALAGSMGLAVIAEGVEVEAQRTRLAEMGCENYQGYLFSKPLPIAELEALLAKS